MALAGITERTGSKLSALEGQETAESQLRHRALVGTVATSRAWLGAMSQPRYDKAQGMDRCQLVLEEVRARIDEERTSRMVGMWQQEAWTR